MVYDLPENLHPLARLFGLETRIESDKTYKTTLILKKDENPAVGTVYKGFTVTKEAYVDDEDLVVDVIEHMAHVEGNFDAGWAKAPTEAEAVALVPKAFVEWAKEQKQRNLNRIQIHKERIQIMEDFVKGLDELGIS